MYYVLMENHNYSYEIYEMVTLYFPGEKISICEAKESIPSDCMLIKSKISMDKNIINCDCSMNRIVENNYELVDSVSINSLLEEDNKKSIKHIVKLSVFELLKSITGIEMPWGILVGIRPTKIVNDLKSKQINKDDIYSILKRKYQITDNKIDLVMEVSDNSYKLINCDKKNVSIYIGIPFCPTRCIYCSFASYPITQYNRYVEQYVSALQYELKEISRFLNGKFKVDTIYVGGGTPTSLSNIYFEQLLNSITGNFEIKYVNEFTVEAGRPDTINTSKLGAMKQNNVSRISINPQSMNEKTLERIGRLHTIQEVLEKYKMAREYGFNNINMDMILGLPGENMDEIKYTTEKLVYLSPENITVHTMAVKRASKLKEKIIDNEYTLFSESGNIVKMMDYVYDRLHFHNYIPYYMYRQKMMIGNLENVGYSKIGFECLYNIQMIEEKETIIGIGVDAVTKFVFHDENRIERFSNKKDIKEYISTIHENTAKKIELLGMLT